MAEAPVLTLEARGEVETEESREDVIWHEIHNAYRIRRILTGQLGGIEQTDNGKTIYSHRPLFHSGGSVQVG